MLKELLTLQLQEMTLGILPTGEFPPRLRLSKRALEEVSNHNLYPVAVIYEDKKVKEWSIVLIE